MNAKKCIILDLDNTLWGGIVGEDGFDGIKLSLSGPGAGFVAFQQVLLDLYNRGIILAINSRNNFEDAIKVIRTHPNMILKENNFAAMRINWNDKVSNLIELAREINIGLDSVVFLDDDPVNRELVKIALPEVEVPEMPASYDNYAKFLLGLPYFESGEVTNEDKMRGNFYVTERLRREAEKSFNDQERFFKSLELELQIFIDDSSQLARLAQLTEKTNQFNANKHPFSEENILNFINSPEYKVFYGRLTDRFGDYGIIIFAIVKKELDLWHVDHFLMSCRVIGRGVENAFLSAIGKNAKENGVEKLSITFIQTDKNKPAKEFVEKYFKNSAAQIDDIIDLPHPVAIKYGKIK